MKFHFDSDGSMKLSVIGNVVSITIRCETDEQALEIYADMNRAVDEGQMVMKFTTEDKHETCG